MKVWFRMVWRTGLGKVVILCLSVLTGGVAAGQAPAPGGSSGEAAAILGAARETLGGDKRISSIKTIVTTGRTQQVQGDNLVPIEFEIAIELPDKYVRRDEIPARESGPSSRGFNGDGLIQIGDVPGGGPRRGGPPLPVREGFHLPARPRVKAATAGAVLPARRRIPPCRSNRILRG